MSKQRQHTRAARQAEAARKEADLRAAREAHRAELAAQRARRERRRLLWSRVRLWQHGPNFHRRREGWGVLGTAVLVVLVVVFVVTRSLEAVAGTALICLIAAPVLAKLTLDQRRR